MIPVYKALWIDDENAVSQKMSKSLCSWSSTNWIAYTTGHNSELTTLSGPTTVYVTSPDQPWEAYPVYTQHNGPIEHLEWDPSGTCFVTVEASGIGKIWRKDKTLVNQWMCDDSEVIHFSDGSRVKKILWLDESRHYNIDLEKLGKRDWFQKFSQLKSEPLYNTSTGQTKSGFIVVTLEGLLKIVLLMPRQKPLVYTTRLGSLKSHVLNCDFIQNDSGKVFVALVTEPCLVELFTVSFKESDGGIDLAVEVWPCVVPLVYGDPAYEAYTVEQVKCLKKSNQSQQQQQQQQQQSMSSDQVLVLCRSSNSTFVKTFGIRKEQVVLHQRFSSQQQTAPQYADACCCMGQISIADTLVNQMFVANHNFTNSTAHKVNASLPPKLVLTSTNGAMQVYSLQTFQQVLPPIMIDEHDAIDSAVFSRSNHAMFSVSENGNPMMFVLPPHTNAAEKAKTKNVVNLLQLSIMEGYTPWDIMLYLVSREKVFVEQCLQQFVSDFNEQSTGTNLYYIFYWRYWRIRALFYNVTRDYVGVSESYNLLFFHRVYLFLLCNLQSEKEVALLDKLNTIFVGAKKEVELSKILQIVDTNNLVFSSLSNTLHRPLYQWITDYMVHIIRLILSVNHHKQDWKSILQYFDSNTFLCLRKVCVLLFILYQKSAAYNIQPIYITMVTSLDVLPQLFKLMSKLYLASVGDASQTDLVIAELPFCSLPIMYMEYPVHKPRASVLHQTNIQAQGTGFNYYDIQLTCDSWELIHRTALGNPLVRGIFPVNTQLRQIYDGINFTPSSLMQSEDVKQCCGCGVLTIVNCHASRVLNEGWAACWREQCVCGGLWKKVH